MTKVDLTKYDFDCNDFETVSKWSDELSEAWANNQKEIIPISIKKKAYKKYSELHKNWYKEHFSLAYLITTITLIASVIVGIISMIITKGNTNFAISIGMALIIICGIMFSVYDKVENYVPPRLKISLDDMERYDANSINNLHIGYYMVAFSNRAKYLLTLDKYKNAYATIEGIAKERNCTPEDLYNQYAKKGEV